SLPDLSGFVVHNFGFVSDEHKKALIYSAADVYVLPTLADNLPNVVIESLMCGTPVIGFKTGGVPDMIKHGHNGILVDNINV
ncbi:glycosyltransferase, partial [Fulvivirgaceae bacterium PWU5]